MSNRIEKKTIQGTGSDGKKYSIRSEQNFSETEMDAGNVKRRLVSEVYRTECGLSLRKNSKDGTFSDVVSDLVITPLLGN